MARVIPRIRTIALRQKLNSFVYRIHSVNDLHCYHKSGGHSGDGLLLLCFGYFWRGGVREAVFILEDLRCAKTT